MSEKPNEIRKSTTIRPSWMRARLILGGAIFLMILIFTLFLPGGPSAWDEWAIVLAAMMAVSLLVSILFLGGWWIVRGFFNRRNFKRSLFAIACLATLVAFFYAEEDFRGKRAWENYKRKWE